MFAGDRFNGYGIALKDFHREVRGGYQIFNVQCLHTYITNVDGRLLDICMSTYVSTCLPKCMHTRSCELQYGWTIPARMCGLCVLTSVHALSLKG